MHVVSSASTRVALGRVRISRCHHMPAASSNCSNPRTRCRPVRAYQTHLRQFHIWLNANHVSLVGLERSHIESWLAWLHARHLAACTRVHAIQNIRAYLESLEEQRVLSVPADTLIRGSDLPKLPKYLPRPVPPDTDLLLQRRFKKSGCMYQLGLLLMRRTGLRIGELIALPYHCIRTDHSGNTLLKVPLGKLATERLVPLDPAHRHARFQIAADRPA